jgi:MYXO-CTERM domain-containing protein
MKTPHAGCLLFALTPLSALAQQIVVAPYLQMATPGSMIVRWETDDGEDAAVDWGPTSALGSTVVGESWGSGGGTVLHRAELTGLTPGSTVFYVARSEAWSSDVTSFAVPASDPDAVRFIAVSDMQRDGANPTVFRDLIADGVLPWVAQNVGGELPEAVQAMLVPGDLVDTGWDYDTWVNEFFAPAAPLMSRVPTYPVPGNHEADTDYYFDYFDLPTNGTAGYEEHWWSHDVGRVRVVGLDSNAGYLIAPQIDWLEGVLATSCDDPAIDFVVAQLHHPFKSELWTPGENLWTGQVVTRLETFTSSCGKPSVHLFGHTHGYSRGQSRDHSHLWVNVASAGGAIDYWGEQPQADYDEFVVSQDDWGFVVLEAESAPTPSLRLRRISRGNRDGARDNELRDEVTVRVVNDAPATPSSLAPAGGDTPAPEETLLVGSPYSDPDGDPHGSSHWQVATSCDGFEAPVVDRWVQHRNEFLGEDRAAGDDLTDLLVDSLGSETSYCWRVRYRDQALGWSAWSEPSAFVTARASFTDNLLDNPGAEEGLQGWEVLAGSVEALQGGECDAIEPHGGDRLFSVGGACDPTDFGAARQVVQVGLYADRLDAGRATARLGGWMSDWGGDDEPAMQLVFRDGAGEELGRGTRLAMRQASWQWFSEDVAGPPGTRGLEVRLEGTRNAGTDNDSYIDDLELRLRFAPIPSGDENDAGGEDPDPAAQGCGCASSPAGGARGPSGGAWGLAFLGMMGVLRRRG